MEMFNEWWLYIIIELILAVLFAQFYKIATKSMQKAGALTVLLQALAGIIILSFLPLFKITFPSDFKTYLFLGIAIIFYALSDRLNTDIRKELQASIFNITLQISTVFMITSGFLFFKEPFVVTKFIGALLIIFSNILIFYEKGTMKINKTIVTAIFSNLFFSIAIFLDVNISTQFNLPFYVAITLLFPAVIIFIGEKIKFLDIKNEWTKGNKKAILITSLCWGTMILAQLMAYKLGQVTVVAPLLSLVVILNVIMGYFFFHEKDNLLKKIIAAVLIIISVFLIKL